jgi:hypothetical protein
MAISDGHKKTVRLGAVLSKSLNAFGRRAIIFIIISAIAHIPLFLWYFVLVHYADVLALFSTEASFGGWSLLWTSFV